jgi:hypothetical protein
MITPTMRSGPWSWNEPPSRAVDARGLMRVSVLHAGKALTARPGSSSMDP